METYIRKKKSLDSFHCFTGLQIGFGFIQKQQMKDELYNSIYENIYNSLRNELLVKLKKDIKEELKKDIKKDIEEEYNNKIDKLNQEIDALRREIVNLSDIDSEISLDTPPGTKTPRKDMSSSLPSLDKSIGDSWDDVNDFENEK